MEENKNIVKNDEQKNTKNKSMKENVKTVATVVIFAIIFFVAAGSGCIRCTWCGDDDNRLILYASGTSDNGVEYESFVGPAGCLGFGIDSKCWPTECIHIQKNTSGGGELSGCVTYYNETGCIANSKVKSEGTYSDQATCLGVNCIGEKYIETKAVTTKAKEQTTCMGIGCGGASATESKGYNAQMPRQFKNGCWENE